MHNRLIEMVANSTAAHAAGDRIASGQLANTGGESLSLVWWIGAGLLVVGVTIGLIAFLRRRNASTETSDSPDTSE